MFLYIFVNIGVEIIYIGSWNIVYVCCGVGFFFIVLILLFL